MKSMETILAESIGEMDVFEKDDFFKRRKSGMALEAQAALAREILDAEDRGVRRSRSIKRNNGGTRQLSEAERSQGAMQRADEILFESMAKSRNTAQGLTELVEVNGEYRRKDEGADRLSESEAQDAAFCRLLGMSEADAVKVAKSNAIRG